MSSRSVCVYVCLGSVNHLAGRLWCHHRKGRESATFEYDASWLQNPERFALEPALSLTPGPFQTVNDQALFGPIGDSAPDRWGRVLMRRAEIASAKEAGRQASTLGEFDYLLGVNDTTRQGALRFSLEEGGPFLSHGARPVPPLIELPRLLTATERYLDDEESADDLRLLLAPGSSLGGARPKASVLDHQGQLSIAKFPRKDDEFNVVTWEAVVLHLAKESGIRVPHWRLEIIADKPVLILERFDRYRTSNRIPFLSAMSMIGARDNEAHSYLELADAIMQFGAAPAADLSELWRRIVFTVLVSNTDDHLRNHGFLYDGPKGWTLSPAYDINPTPIDLKARVLTTAIDLSDTTASLDVAMSVASDFRLTKATAKSTVREVGSAVARWRQVATDYGMTKSDVDRLASAFEHDDLRMAQTF